MRAVAIVICLTFIVVGCGTPAREERTAQQPVDGCDAARHHTSSQQIASIAPVNGGSRTQATSWVGYKDLYELAWASHLIVRGQVTADCGTGESPQFGLESPKEMLVTIDAVYRGLPRTSVLVPRTSDGFSNDPRLSFDVGDDVILFLSEPEDGGAWPVGGPQGHWRVVEDHAVPYEGMFPELPIEAFAEAIATALRQDPPSPETHYPSLNAAPIGPALPDAGTPPLACGARVPHDSEYVEATRDLVWLSERVVVGTVSEIPPSVVPDNPMLDIDRSLRVPVTDYVISVDQVVRGPADEELSLRLPGGTIDGCTISVFGDPDLATGDRLVLFLSPLDDHSETYVTTSGQRGLWKLEADGVLASNTAWHSVPQVVPAADLISMVADALAGETPGDQWATFDPVPLAASPTGDTSWAGIDIPEDWALYNDLDNRFSLRHPIDWSPGSPTDDAVFSIASWSQSSADETVPDGQMRIDIRHLPTNRWFADDSSVPVLAGGHHAWLYFDISHGLPDAENTQQGYRIVATYLGNGVVWEVTATFAKQPSSNDSATLAFYTMLRSIQHPGS